MDESDSAQIEVSARWTCEACGCRTNTEVGDPTSCGVCGTRRGEFYLALNLLVKIASDGCSWLMVPRR